MKRAQKPTRSVRKNARKNNRSKSQISADRIASNALCSIMMSVQCSRRRSTRAEHSISQCGRIEHNAAGHLLELSGDQRLGGALQARRRAAVTKILRRGVGAFHQQEELIGEA